jgi:hypothetical protein
MPPEEAFFVSNIYKNVKENYYGIIRKGTTTNIKT